MVVETGVKLLLCKYHKYNKNWNVFFSKFMGFISCLCYFKMEKENSLLWSSSIDPWITDFIILEHFLLYKPAQICQRDDIKSDVHVCQHNGKYLQLLLKGAEIKMDMNATAALFDRLLFSWDCQGMLFTFLVSAKSSKWIIITAGMWSKQHKLFVVGLFVQLM